MDKFHRKQEGKLIINFRSYPIFKGVNTIGRNKAAVVNIKNVNVSQNHAFIIIVDENHHFISDSNSSNGTNMQNSKLVPFKLYELSDNAEIKFGDVTARYLKITSDVNSTINLASQTMDVTQNLTQNFYASNTQLMDTINECNNDHSYINSSRRDSQEKTVNCHDIATQQVNYPELVEHSDSANQKKNDQIVEENVDFNVHDAPTQVINSPVNNVISHSKQLEEQQCVIDSINADLHLAPTQVVSFPSDACTNKELQEKLTKEKSSDSNDSEATQLVNEEISQLLEKTSLNQKDVEKLSQNSSQETVISETNIKKYPTSTSRANTLHYSQEPSTSGGHHKLSSIDDSFSNSPINTSKDLSIEDTVMENSNDSVDFLTMDLTHNDNIEPKLESTIQMFVKNAEENNPVVSSQFKLIHNLKEKNVLEQSDFDTGINNSTTKRSDNQNNATKSDEITKVENDEDSDTDIDEPLNITHDFAIIKDSEKQSNSSQSSDVIGPKRKLIPKISSDSEGELSQDNENTQDIGFKKKPSKQLPSDDETTQQEIEKYDKVTEKYLASDGDTDIEDDLYIIKSKSEKSNLTGRLEISKKELEETKLNDSDCIPATQDLLVDVFGGSSTTRDSGRQSSEESFKLGITELMDDLQSQPSNIQEEKTSKESKGALVSEKLNDTDKLELEGKIQKNGEQLNKERCLTNEEDNEDNEYLMATQKISDNEKAFSKDVQDTQDIYMLPTQQITGPQESEPQFKTPKKFHFKKKSALLDSSLTTILGPGRKDNPVDDDDIYMIATQKMNETGSNAVQKSEETENDFYLQPTQSLNNDDEFYAASTQRINKPEPSRHPTTKLDTIEENDETLYLQPTQCLTDEKEIDSHVPEISNKTKTGILHEKEDDLKRKSPIKIDPTKEDSDAFALPTQVITETNENGDTLPFLKQNVEVCSTNRPTNPLAHVLNNVTISTTSNNNRIIKHSRRDSSDLFEIPQDPIVKASTKSSRNSKVSEIEDEDRPETLSQIAAFIKKPPEEFQPKTRQRTELNENKTVIAKKKLDEDRPETLSQIEAFIKKPIVKQEKATEQIVPKERSSISENTASKSQRVLNRKSTLKLVEKTLSTLQNICEDNDDDFQPSPKKRREFQKKFDNKNIDTVKSDENQTNTFKDQAETCNKTVALGKSTLRVDEKSFTLQNNADDFDDNFEPSPKNSKGYRKKVDKEANQANKSMETIKSDVDQSFVALLESKSGKVKKKVSSNLGDIQVTATSNRRSMSIEEMSANHLTDLSLVQLRKTRNTSRTIVKQSIDTQNKRKLEVKPQNKKKSADDNSKIELSDSEIPSKISKINLDQKAKSINKEVIEHLENTKMQNVGRRVTRRSSAASNSSDIPKVEIKNMKKTRSRTGSDRSDTSEEREELVSKNKRKRKNSITKENKPAAEVPIKSVPSDITEDDIEQMSHNSKDKRKTRHKPSKWLTSSSEDVSSDNVAKPGQITTPSKSNRSSRTKNVKNEDMSSEASTAGDVLLTPRRRQNKPTNEVLLNSAERSKRKQKPKVVFTMLDSPQLESLIKQLGGSVVDSVDSSTVLVTEHVKRSQKLLTAIGQGKPICSPNWLLSSKKSHEFLDPWDYILLDKEAERKWDFSLKESLIRASNKKLLDSYTFQLIVSNAADVLKGAIEACGGKCVNKNPNKSSPDNYVIVASPDHKAKYSKIVKQYPHVKVVDPEAIFDGVLRQELRFSRHLLN